MNLPKSVNIKEVGPRDGLQNENKIVTTEDKIEWINQLSQTGLSYLEITSFVHPKWIPQLKDAVEVARKITRNPDVTYAALVPNMKGLERALSVDIDEISIFMSTSETHNQKNINKPIRDTYPVLGEVIKEAKKENKTIRGYVSTVFGCPYEGEVPIDQVIRICDQLFTMGIDELSLGDTIGVANPVQVKNILTELIQRFPKQRLALHFHNTRGMALANVVVSLQMGITTFDSSLGGLGGCPYAKGASGNLATDDLVHMLKKMGIETGVKEEGLEKSAVFIQQVLGKSLSSHQMEIWSNQ
jgi:hydroxymethylglutaryl-CoA lyase